MVGRGSAPPYLHQWPFGCPTRGHCAGRFIAPFRSSASVRLGAGTSRNGWQFALQPIRPPPHERSSNTIRTHQSREHAQPSLSSWRRFRGDSNAISRIPVLKVSAFFGETNESAKRFAGQAGSFPSRLNLSFLACYRAALRPFAAGRFALAGFWSAGFTATSLASAWATSLSASSSRSIRSATAFKAAPFTSST